MPTAAIIQIIFQLRLEYQIVLHQERQLEHVLAGLSIWSPQTGLILKMTNYSNWDTLSLNTQIFTQEALIQQLQQQFQTTILIGAALKYQRSFKNFCQQLGITQTIPAKDRLSLKRDYILDDKIKVYLPR
ncbi:hypothetical protein EQ500_13250, partial [Lactobacillus sp. XV13L]|nr:hypothetical protein [Lactobacillus sp. XV13L]